jgi:carbamoyltransferase
VIDAIGESDTVSIYNAWYDQKGRAQYKKLWGRKYPHSIGMFYSALTQHVGLHPMDEEYITMGMAAYGHGPKASGPLIDNFIEDLTEIKFKQNLHIGFPDDIKFDSDVTNEDKAAAGQWLVEQMVYSIVRKAKHLTKCNNLVLQGGVALNCVANSQLYDVFPNIWIMPNPGDAGSSLGAAALAHGKKVNWQGPYLGTNIGGEYPVEDLVRQLKVNKIVGVASGRAEFGPRALGNRSLLADPRGSDIKDAVNEIKRRQKFRPFAPAILAEHANKYFDGPVGPYMQFVSKCKQPDKFPAIVHADGTSRVQAVEKDGSGFRRLLEAWYKETKCPMLLNTSLNIRGEPMVDTRFDADRFQKKYGITVCS